MKCTLRSSLELSFSSTRSVNFSYSMFLIVFLLKIVTCVFAENQISCESITKQSWIVTGRQLTCFISPKAVIDSKSFIISSVRDEQIRALRFISNKQISYLPVNVHEKFPVLISFSAVACNIKSIFQRNFQNLNTLRELWLNGNQIKTIASDTFGSLTSLEYLDLGKLNLDSHNSLLYVKISNFSTRKQQD